jgi:hypothetical protein
MNTTSFTRRPLVACVILLVGAAFVAPPHAEGQFWKRTAQAAACAAGGFAGVKLGDKLAEIEAKRLNLSPAAAAKRKKAFQIGLALALCGGGSAIAGTTYSRLSKRGQEARGREIMKALEDSSPTPHTYTDPDVPSLSGIVVAERQIVQGDLECRVVQDRLGNDEAVVKYCRSPGGAWTVGTT